MGGLSSPQLLMSSKAIKIGVTCVVLAARASAGLMYTTLAKGTEYYKHVDEVMTNPASVAGQAPAAPRLRRRSSISGARHARLPLPGPEQRQGHPRALHRRRARHLQERGGSRAQGAAARRRLRRRRQRRDGEVSVEVRGHSRHPRRREARTMASLGSFILLATFVAASYAIAASVAGARRRSHAPHRERRRRVLPRSPALMTVASAIIVHAFVTGNFTIKYVQHYSDSAQPLAYKIASYWGGLDGSIMFWVFLLSVFGIDRRRRQPRAPPRADSLGGRRHLRDGDVLHLHHGGAQQPVRDVPRQRRRPTAAG